MGEPSLRERALRHLARRDHSRAELARKLAAHGDADEIAAVIERNGGELEYWAVQHVAEQPDFHARNSFVLMLKTWAEPDGKK